MRRFFPKTIAAADIGMLALLALLVLAAAYRIFLVVNLPIWLRHTLVQEDALYLRLAESLTSGHWLGPYDQLTLMSGPGYPLFLALNSFTGIPVSAAHALFQVVAIGAAAWAVYRLSLSRVLAAATFLILTFDPAGFLPEIQRIIPEQIYWAQVLIVFSLATILLYTPPPQASRAISLGVFIGAALGWTWLTRDDNGWLLLGLAFLVLGAGVIRYADAGSLRILARNSAAATAACLGVLVLVMSANLAAYGTFAVSDAKERNLVAALNALEKIDAGPFKPYVPITAEARTKAAKASPSFAPLNRFLNDWKFISQWSDAGCVAHRQTCGDISAGSLLWAFRDAAGMSGFYETPQSAATGYGKIAQEITTACAERRLKCRAREGGAIPETATRDRPSFLLALNDAAGKVVSLDGWSKSAIPPTLAGAEPEKLERYWGLLNRPFVSTPGARGLQTTLKGWYRDATSWQWPGFAVLAEHSAPVSFVLTREPSPDLQRTFADPRPGFNRFKISYRCPDKCTLAVLVFNEPELKASVDRLHDIVASRDKATLYIDRVTYDWNATADLGPLQKLAFKSRAALVAVYGALMPLFILAGFVAFVAAIDGAISARYVDRGLLVTSTAWLLVGVQIGALGLSEASLVPATTLQLALPIAYLAVFAALLSFGSAIVQARRQMHRPSSSFGAQMREC